jgi:hypothetical protein
MESERTYKSRDPRLLIDLVTDYDPNQGTSVHQNLYIKEYPGKVSVKDLHYDQDKTTVTLLELEYLYCYRDDCHV